jgi:hypothetical protein
VPQNLVENENQLMPFSTPSLTRVMAFFVYLAINFIHKFHEDFPLRLRLSRESNIPTLSVHQEKTAMTLTFYCTFAPILWLRLRHMCVVVALHQCCGIKVTTLQTLASSLML